MNVYHNASMWGNDKQKPLLTARSINRTFLWEGQEIFIPAVYVGKSGAVLDVCAKISVEDMAAFFKKWNKERRLSLRTSEEYELIEADNPSSKDFSVEMSFDGIPLVCGVSSSLNWYPEEVFRTGCEDGSEESSIEEWKNDNAAEKMMNTYECDRKCCWHFGRLSYNWEGEPLLSPHNVSLIFQARFIPVTAKHFTTDISCRKKQGQIQLSPARCLQDDNCMGTLPVKLMTVHPATGQEYTLTLHGCKQTRHTFDDIAEKNAVFPEYSQVLSYSVSPEISRDFFAIRDCAESDQPVLYKIRKKSRRANAISVFMADKNPIPGNQTAVSSLHFEPQEKVRWRIVFQVQTKADLKISFPILDEV